MEQFSYESFVASYKNDDRLKTLVKNFNDKEIIFAMDSTDSLPQGNADGKQVSTMAKRATDLTDLA